MDAGEDHIDPDVGTPVSSSHAHPDSQPRGSGSPEGDGEAPPFHQLDSLAPGLHQVRLNHRENSVRSVQESSEVVAQVGSLQGRSLTDDGVPRALTASDILVLTASTEQTALIADD